MANHKSAIKRNRQNIRRRASNQIKRASVRGVVKDTREAVAAGDVKLALESLRTAERALAKAKSQGLAHWRNAARRTSRLAQQVAKLSKGKKK